MKTYVSCTNCGEFPYEFPDGLEAPSVWPQLVDCPVCHGVAYEHISK